jgi:hypothetical protein
VVGCRDATILRAYTVQARGGRAVITVQNGRNPFTVTLGAEGVLSGSGTVRVDGRVVTGSGPDGKLTYAPRSEECAVDALPPR